MPVETSTRERIVEAALRLFAERGTSGSSMRDIADAAGVTVPGLYYHFAGKADLIRAVYAARGLDAVLKGGPAQPLPPLLRHRVAEQARRELARFQDEAEFFRIMAVEQLRLDADALEVGGELGDAWRRRWEDILRGSADVDPGADLAAAAACIPTFLWGLYMEHLTRPDAALAARIDHFAALIAPGLTKGSS